MKYLVCEVQHFPNDQVSTFVWAFDTENSANAKYHQILSGAATSTLPVHSATMFTEEGFFLKGEYFRHETEPEPDEEA